MAWVACGRVCLACRDTQALKNKIKSLEEEKERLGEKVERAKGAVDKLPDRSSYMDVCTSLRKQQDEEVNLSTAIQVWDGSDAVAGLKSVYRHAGGPGACLNSRTNRSTCPQ